MVALIPAVVPPCQKDLVRMTLLEKEALEGISSLETGSINASIDSLVNQLLTHTCVNKSSQKETILNNKCRIEIICL